VNSSSLDGARETAVRLIANIEKVIVGKRDSVRLVVMALLCRGHVLVEGGPGMGKTMLARSMAHSISGSFKRIQCTSDLLPSDITGTYVFDQRDGEFHFRAGPVLANLVLVDEINRASPRTQSAFLEAMEERQISVDGITHALPSPFQLIATRNPLHHGGTFPLPETELDRFLLRVQLDYPSPDEEVAMVERQVLEHPIDSLEQVVKLDEIMGAQATVRQVYVDRLISDYVVAIVNATRHHPSIHMGASPRATLGLVRMAQVHALMEGRDFTLPDDVKAVAVSVLGHRVILIPGGESLASADEVVSEVTASVPVETGQTAAASPPTDSEGANVR
jgi:MoxR-like ATPase